MLAIASLVLAGCASRASCPAGDLALPPQAPAFVVVRSDQATSAALALLAADGTLIDLDFIDSGTRVSSLVTSLSGDVVVPSTPLGDRTIAWLDRFNVDQLALFADGAITAIDTRGESATSPHTGFSANPYDAVSLGDGRILVARYGLNHDASAPELQRGNDVIVIERGLVTRRIDLRADGVLDAARCAGTDCTAYARPSVLLPLASGGAHAILVVLDRLSRDFMAAGTGALVTIDPATLAVSSPLALEGLENCYYASRDPSDTSRASVLCSGRPFSTEDGRRSSSGIVEVTLDASGALSVTQRFDPGPADAAPFNGIIGIDRARVLYVAAGSLVTGVPDRLVDLDLATGTASIVYRAATAFVLGEGVAATGGALVPDAAANAILRVAVDPTRASVTGSIALDDCIGLPPRQIRPLRF